MQPKQNKQFFDLISFSLKGLTVIVSLITLGLGYAFYATTILPAHQKQAAEERAVAAAKTEALADLPIENGIHTPTGFVEGEGLEMVVATCTACHSAKLVTQNRADHEGWTQMIRWMQETQNLWDLGEQEEVIVNYLAKNYAPSKTGRRKGLGEIDWYELK